VPRLVLLLALALTAVLVPRSGAAAGPAAGLVWRVDSAPFRLTVLQDGDPLVRQHTGAAGPGTRMSYRIREGGGMHTLTSLLRTQTSRDGAVYTVATSEPDRTATVTVTRMRVGLRVRLDLGVAHSNVRTVYESFDSTASEHFLGTGERRDFVDLQGQIVPLKVWHECGSAKPAAFFVSSRGYAARFAGTAVGRMGFGRVAEGEQCQLGTSPCEIASGPDVVQACFKASSLSYEIYPGAPEQAVRAYAARTGRPPLPRPEQLALTKWRDQVGSEAELTEDADRFEQAGIPLGWLILDNPWEAGACAGSMQFDGNRWSDPAGMVDRLHERGLRLMLWVSPMVRTVCGRDFYPRDRVIGPDEYQAIDLTDPAVAATFEQRLVNALASGVDGFKVDRGDEVDLELTSLAGGSGDDVHNAYPLLLAQSIQRATRAARGTDIPTLFRAGFTGAQRLETGSWSGDLPGSWGGLEQAVRSAQTAGLAGYSTWGSDVGGYNSGKLSVDLFLRWAQLGAVSPILEVGGVGDNATPWKIGKGAMEGLRSAALLHYELFPYHYQLAREAHATGVPVLRPLAFAYPDDAGSWRADDEILVGPSLLAAPVVQPGSSAPVYLPPGEWLDLGTGATVSGPSSLVRATRIDEIPLYLRVGAAIPYNLRSPDVWRSPWGLNDLFRSGRAGWLLAPGTTGAAGSSAEYGTIRATWADDRLRIAVRRAGKETQVLVAGGRAPREVRIDGRMVPRSRGVAALRASRAGWLLKRGAPAGVVLKLAPRGGRSTVELAY
jgi:alpha-D-xyloside xylohydrolase